MAVLDEKASPRRHAIISGAHQPQSQASHSPHQDFLRFSGAELQGHDPKQIRVKREQSSELPERCLPCCGTGFA
jgi:hypothetical protein